jgi:threonylcarbamoyladenosine tRNA methylthiotransferase MtaB
MSGFPGEDAAAHKNTCALIEDLPVSYLHVFPFSPRRGTLASKYDGQNTAEVIKKRAEELRRIGQKKRTAFYRACLHKDFLVLVEERQDNEKMVKGLADNYVPVLFEASEALRKDLISVRIERVVKNRVEGFALDCAGSSLRSHGP